ncbi:hypothetical protein CPSG_04773 [Coccidioides posadasii str. Silveira]|uniref:Uncharacterized protein n=2 Tax=Coccidioides posadasii TaxID=199306 RepID=E9D593_COCPS|nr:hypothetical protein CPSG_04773 [Coccidioides posadasii str. Silveira]KMM66838.1 hypothetical protein CPAG_03175 [Coccidioides posadasii RMSCC 3488]
MPTKYSALSPSRKGPSFLQEIFFMHKAVFSGRTVHFMHLDCGRVMAHILIIIGDSTGTLPLTPYDPRVDNAFNRVTPQFPRILSLVVPTLQQPE